MDVLETIRRLKDRLWAEYGDVLQRDNTQDEKHMTYYIGDLLERRGFEWFKSDHGTAYTEAAMQAAFIAGLRIGQREAKQIADRIVDDRVSRAISILQGGSD